jgi:hypothetical protein
MDHYLETEDLGHRFLGYIRVAPRTNDRAGGGSGTEDDLDEYSRRNDAERHAGTRDLDEGGGVASEVAQRAAISAIGPNERESGNQIPDSPVRSGRCAAPWRTGGSEELRQ